MTDKLQIITELQYRLQALAQQMADITKQLQAMQTEVAELSADIVTVIEFVGDENT